MTELEESLASIQLDLDRLRVRWALVGGFAVSLRAEVRQTLDLDVAVAVPGDAEAETLIRELRSRGYRERQDDGVMLHRDTDRIATIRLDPPRGGVIVDLLFASSGIEPEIVAGCERLLVTPDFGVPVASVGHLLALKILAGRPKDLGDVALLNAVASLLDLRVARAALELIERRGYHRGKDLLSALERALAGHA